MLSMFVLELWFCTQPWKWKFSILTWKSEPYWRLICNDSLLCQIPVRSNSKTVPYTVTGALGLRHPCKEGPAAELGLFSCVGGAWMTRLCHEAEFSVTGRQFTGKYDPRRAGIKPVHLLCKSLVLTWLSVLCCTTLLQQNPNWVLFSIPRR